MTLIYKILSRAEWQAAQAAGQLDGSAVDLADGFIHLSAADQAQETAARYFVGQADLVLLGVETEALGEALKWEASRGGALFPHLYRPLLPSEVVSQRSLELDADGVPQLGVLSA
jgi:uncharacterized protein (DUF952 family)